MLCDHRSGVYWPPALLQMTQLTVRMGSQPEAGQRIDDLDGSSAVGVKMLDLFLHIVASKQKKTDFCCTQHPNHLLLVLPKT